MTLHRKPLPVQRAVSHVTATHPSSFSPDVLFLLSPAVEKMILPYLQGTGTAIGEKENSMEVRNFDEVNIGEIARFSKTITEADIWAFGAISGDFNPLHMDKNFAKTSMFGTRVAHGMLAASAILPTTTELTGLGGVHISQEIKFLAPVRPGDSVAVVSEVIEKLEGKNRLVIKSTITNQHGTIVIEAKAVTMIPKKK